MTDKSNRKIADHIDHEVDQADRLMALMLLLTLGGSLVIVGVAALVSYLV